MPRVISADPTPNENAMKFTLDGRLLASGSKTFNAQTAGEHPVAAALFRLPGVKSAFFLNDFVTVSKDPGASFNDLESAIIDAINSAAG